MKKIYQTLSAVIIMIIATVSMAVGQTCQIWMDSLVTEVTDTSFCSTTCPSVTIYRPTAGTGTIEWQLSNPTTLILNVDSVVVSSNRSIWFLLNGTPIIGVTVNFVAPLDSLQFLMADQTVCPNTSVTLNPGASIYTDYLWTPNGETTQSVTVNDSGTYSVNITNVCGSTSSVAHIANFAVITPDIGPNQNICLNTSITLDAGAGYTTYWWSNDSTSQTISVDTTGTYSVGTVDANGCTGSDEMDLVSVLPYETPEICIASFDTGSQKNKVIWLSTQGLGFDSLIIYKETVQDVWTPLGTVINTAGEFIDVTSQPQNSADSYKIAVQDTCGNVGPMSPGHTTINLVISYNPINDILGYLWTDYIGMSGPIPTYTINGMDALDVVTEIGSVPGNQNSYNYLSPDPAYVKYFVSFDASCGTWQKTETVVLATSNIVNSTVVGIQEPAPQKPSVIMYGKIVTITGNFTYGIVTDVLGRQITQFTEGGFMLPEGIYIVSLFTKHDVVHTKVVAN